MSLTKVQKWFANALDYAKFDVICSDLLIDDTVLEGKCIPYKIVNTQGTKIGFFSLMTEDFPLITSAGNIKLKANNFTVAQDMVNTLQNEKCDIIVAVTHIGLEQDKALANNINGIDVIFGGHSHRYTKKLLRINDTLIINGGEQGTYVAKLDLPLDSQQQIKKEESVFELIPVTDPIVTDKEVEATLKGIQSTTSCNCCLGENNCRMGFEN